MADNEVRSGIQKMLDESRERRMKDAERYKAVDEDLCMLCSAYGADKRTLMITCFYAIHEMVPEAIDLTGLPEDEGYWHGYYLRICKSCRARLLGHLQTWRDECVGLREMEKDHDGHPLEEDETRRIYVRINGINVGMNEQEYYEWRRKEDKKRGL